jgi:hypothetical protein
VKIYTFKELEGKIVSELDKLDKQGYFGKDSSLTILNSFGIFSLQDHIGGSYQIGGSSLPVVIVIDNKNGRVYEFALKKLVPELELI